ncbi:hypothetical protein B2G74_00385 [Burkholderia sp. A27]|nr:hypothetical protein B2G74_00385 [Burkholderia sp. A27]
MEVPIAATVAIDTILLGRIGAGAIAAGGVGAAVFVFVASVGVSIISSVRHEAAYRVGRRDWRGMSGVLYGGVALACVLGLVATLALVASAWSLRALSVDGNAGSDAANYLYGVAPGLPFLLVAVCYRGIISLQPDVKRLTGVAAATVAVKALLAGVGCAWLSRHSISARGGLLLCGVTTSTAFIAMAAAAWLTRCRSMPQSLRAMTPDATIHDAQRIFRRGLTIGLTAALQAGFFSLVAFVCGACSPVDLAAHQVANQCTLLPLMLAFGMSQAAATLTSGALGAQSGRMALRVGWEAVYFAIAAMFVIAGVLLALGHVAIAAILPAGTPERDHVASLAWRLVFVGAFCLAADGAHNVAMGALRGLNQGRLTIYSAIVGYWLVGIPLAWWLGVVRGIGATGVWIGVGAGLHVSAAMLLYFLHRAKHAMAVENDATTSPRPIAVLPRQ